MDQVRERVLIGKADRYSGQLVILALVSSAIIATYAGHALAADKVFTIANYPVEARDKNAVSAKEKALAEGQQAALRSLLKRIVPVTAYSRLQKLSALNASSLVSGVSVRSERNSSVDYIANLDFSFQPEAIRRALSNDSVPFVEDQAPVVTVIPVVRDGEGAKFRADTGAWNAAWRSLDLDHSVTPLKVDSLRSTIHSDVITSLAQGNDDAFRVVAGEYKSDLIVVAIVDKDKPAKKITVTLAGRDASGSILLPRNYRVSDGDYDYSIELGAVVALGVIEGRWKAGQTAGGFGAGPTGGGAIAIQAEFTSDSEWNAIRRGLLETPGVDNLDIASVSTRDAALSLTFEGGADALAAALSAKGIRLSRAGQGWVVTAGY